MAYLSNEQILKILKEGNKPDELRNCHKHDIRAKFHVEARLNISELEYYQSFIDWVGMIINKEKLEVFKHLLTLPIETVEFTEGVLGELTKVFEAQNKYIGFEFTNPELGNDFEGYRKKIGDVNFWQTKGFQAMKSAINSFVVVDLPAVQKSQFPEPYYYLLDTKKIRSVDVDEHNKVEFIIFESRNSDRIVYAFDDGFYRTYQENDKNELTLVSETPHDLGYCPARSFWTTPFSKNSKIQKKSPLSNSLARLDWLLFLYTSTKHVELYAGFPIDVVYETKCTYRDAEGSVCDNGMVRRTIKGDLMGNELIQQDEPCPVCQNRKSLGAGHTLIAPAMASKDDPDMLKGMNRIPADKDSLEYLLRRVREFESLISTNIIGYVAEPLREAINEKQVDSLFESQVNTLLEVKENFEKIHRFVLETLGRLRYGSGFMSAVVNYGDKFFLHSVEQLQTQFKNSKENGFSRFELGSQFTQILLTKYKNNPTMLERVKVLSAIEPYIGYNVNELVQLNDKIGLNKNLIRLKIDFDLYVNRFEREFMSVSSFMQFMPFEKKVFFIQEKLLEYVKEDYAEEDAKAEAENEALQNQPPIPIVTKPTIAA